MEAYTETLGRVGSKREVGVGVGEKKQLHKRPWSEEVIHLPHVSPGHAMTLT